MESEIRRCAVVLWENVAFMYVAVFLPPSDKSPCNQRASQPFWFFEFCPIVLSICLMVFVHSPKVRRGSPPKKSNKTIPSVRARPAATGACCGSLLMQLLVVFSGDQEDFCLLKLVLWRSVGGGGCGVLATYSPTPR